MELDIFFKPYKMSFIFHLGPMRVLPPASHTTLHYGSPTDAVRGVKRRLRPLTGRPDDRRQNDSMLYLHLGGSMSRPAQTNSTHIILDF